MVDCGCRCPPHPLYGEFINTIIGFIIVSFVVFLIVKAINRLHHEPEKEKQPTTKDCPFCHKTIPIEASRCPDCTSFLDGKDGSQQEPARAPAPAR